MAWQGTGEGSIGHLGDARSDHAAQGRATRNGAPPSRAPLARGLLAACLFGATAAPVADAAVRFRSTGERTLGGPDALAEQADACEIGTGRLSVRAEGGGACIAYHATAGLDGAAVAIVYFEGDVPSSYYRDGGRLRGHWSGLVGVLERLAAGSRVPHVLMARPGTFGSTGNHGERRTRQEYVLLDAALTRLRERYRIGRFVLTGQSGGATVVGALLTLGRSDVLCATPASGGYDLVGMLDWHAERRGTTSRHREHPATLARMYSVVEHVAGVRTDAGRRIFIVGDPQDRVTPFALQRRLVDRLAASGHHARMVEARAADADRHGLGHVGLRLAALCARGARDEDIQRAAGGP